jgi:hypothetical protein
MIFIYDHMGTTGKVKLFQGVRILRFPRKYLRIEIENRHFPN